MMMESRRCGDRCRYAGPRRDQWAVMQTSVPLFYCLHHLLFLTSLFL